MATKTTVYLDPDSYRRLKAMAAQSGRSAAELVREAVAIYTARGQSGTRRRSIGAGHSGRRDLGERAERYLKGMGERR